MVAMPNATAPAIPETIAPATAVDTPTKLATAPTTLITVPVIAPQIADNKLVTPAARAKNIFFKKLIKFNIISVLATPSTAACVA